MSSTQTPYALPYCGPAPDPGTLVFAWNLDPVLWAAIGIGTGLGFIHLHQTTAGPTRQRAFAGALGLAVVAFISPLCALTVALFTARTLHHLILIGLMAPLLAIALPLRRIPVGAAFFALSVALWAWHVPVIYAAAWDHPTLYWAMQATLLLPAWAVWSAVFAPRRGLGGAVASALPVAAFAGQMGLIGAVLTFAPRPLYLEHLVYTEAFGLTALADQQLAGLVMWVPGMLPFALFAALTLRAAWTHEARI
ncbi:cytochrome c oxidase assembly protein [Roseinatronobacter sp. S2]|uniref:cytochrome c oxidase assembly protein n=1 Tax=Roseinatronobacter sp. S2 TaxID=3035471 RepID=UPI00240F69ED|nr:cytochrome c oxidase assembly protein [Roseinatronobacter sp. S2]WFE76579.1 cytochrome c oxidase assembly protein [Roseinatronobacter sp. S2]